MMKVRMDVRGIAEGLGVESMFKIWFLRFVPVLFVLMSHTATALEAVTIQLRWYTQFQFAGYYAALEKGYYRDAGYEVTLIEGAPGRTPVNEVLAGHAQYGVANSELLYARLQGEPLVALAVIGQHSPSVLLARGDSGISTPQDMAGKQVMMVGGTDDVDFLAMLRNEGIRPEQVSIIPSSYNINDLIEGRTDLFNAYLTNEPYVLKQRGIPIAVINPSNYGIDFYSDILFTTEQELEGHPERVEAIREASLRGWEYAMSHTEEVIDLLRNRYGAKKSAEHLRYEAETLKSLFLPELVEIGHMNPGRWQHMADTFVELGMIAPDYSLAGFLYDPNPTADDAALRQMLRLLLLVSLGGVVVALVLGVFNRRLQREVQTRRIAEERMSRSEKDFRGIFENMQDIYYRADTEGYLTMVSPSVEPLMGYRPNELLGTRLSELYVDPHRREQLMAQLKKQGKAVRGFEVELKHKDDSSVFFSVNVRNLTNERGEVIGVEGTAHDITERKRHEALIEHQVYYDTLTAMPNRRLLTERLEAELERSRRHRHYGALLFLDLDNFKHINDSLGHGAGDQLLSEVAMRLIKAVRNEDTAARLGGDEFVVMMVELANDEETAGNQAQQFAERLEQSLVEPYALGERLLVVTPSIGITLFPDHDADAAELLKQADIAMYRAKSHGKDRIEFYMPIMQQAAAERFALENDMRQGLERGEFVLHYQPQYNYLGELVGAEALLRWQHPQRGMVLPDSFIPVAEESGLILALGQWVLDEAGCQLRRWLDEGRTVSLPRVALNVSARQFHQKDFVLQVLETLQRYGIDGSMLELELTEGLLLKDMDEAIEKMSALKKAGLKLSIDDFGTGYSSLSYLKRLPLDTLKIDQSFVRDICHDADDAAIVDTIIAMTRHLRLDVIAEGVEDEATRQFLEQQGCFVYQGYLFSPPLASLQFSAMLAA